ncbi:putative aryl-alcohol dehydrogenase aad14 [Stygiomarasmius scandens]|uniref:Aryl-alcohol dehydrogenase aad14 n=1 Tax=Marasmiellus scandens TaxID=2682957 RepID=A0ABR1JI91_9AGAR
MPSNRTSPFAPHPKPPTSLGILRVLSPRAGVRVSPICLGGGSIGDRWPGNYLLNEERSFELLDAFFEKGGNFIDTANHYQEETSEEYIGAWMESRGVRDQIVLATKYGSCFKIMDPNITQTTNYTGGHLKSLQLSLKHSLKKLRTDYVDIFYLHWWDYDVSIEEVMDGLHNLVVSGKVLYLGISNTPAWIVAQANQYAKMAGKTPFVIYEGKWGLLDRSFERDIIPMARAHGMALAPFSVLGAGRLRTDEEEERREKSGEKGRVMFGPDWKRTPEEVKLSRALEKVAKEIGAKSITAVAIAYVMQKTPYVFPVVGGRRIEHLEQNIEALDIKLTPEHIKYLESEAPPYDPGMLGDGSESNFLLKAGTYYQKMPYPQALGPATD